MTAQAATPVAVDDLTLRSVTDLLLRRLAEAPDADAFDRPQGDDLERVTTRQFVDEARALAAGLIAVGIQPGDRVGVMAPTRYEWAVVDFACWFAGIVVVPIYETSSVEQTAAIVADAGVRHVVAGSARHAEVLRSADPSLTIWTMDDDLGALAAGGASVATDELERRRALAGRDDLATLVYTSGTTAGAKGVRITHGNLVGLVQQIAHAYADVVHDRANTVIVLPLAHILARALQVAAVASGMRVLHHSDPSTVASAFSKARPTFVVVVPRLLQKIADAVGRRALDARLGGAFAAARRTAVDWAQHLEASQDEPGRRPPLGLRVRHALFERLFYARIRGVLGGRVQYLLSGAAPLDADLARFFWGAGLPVIEGYGLTETTAPVTGNLPSDIRPGTVGRPVPGAEVRIADDGEVQVRGLGVAPGYRNKALDADAFVDGWFRTGDLGRLDADGRLILTGRAKNILVTAGGKNVAPEPWEEAVSAHPLVANAVMVGEGRPFLAALLLLERAEVSAWAARHKLDALAAQLESMAAGPGGVRVPSPELQARLQRIVDRANARVSRAEQVKAFAAVVADTDPVHGTFTPTMKVRRDALLAAARTHVEALYSRT